MKRETYIPSMNVCYFKKLGTRLIQRSQMLPFRKLLVRRKEGKEKYSKILILTERISRKEALVLIVTFLRFAA